MKKKTVEQEMKDLKNEILLENAIWRNINENGCNDPFWADGVNMNLTRNHIIYARMRIYEICCETGKKLPEEYYLPVPPEVDNNYMASLKQEERVKRIRQMGNRINTRKKKINDDGQLNFL